MAVTTSRRHKVRIEDPVAPPPAGPGQLDLDNATELVIRHDADRKAYQLALYRVRVEGQWVTHTLRFGTAGETYYRTLEAAPRFNARRLEAYRAKLVPHYSAMAEAFRKGDRDRLAGLVTGALL